MKKSRCLQKSITFCATIIFTIYFAGCSGSSGPIYADAVIAAGGPCKIDFQPGVKDWNWQTLNIIFDNESYFISNFGKPVWQGSTPTAVETYGLIFHSSWLDVRCANPTQDGESLENIWTAYNAKSVDPTDGSIITTGFGLCVVDYNWDQKYISSVPYGSHTIKHLHKFRIIAKSKSVNGGKYQDSIELTIFANPNYPNTNDFEQLNITITDTDSNQQVVQIVRELQ